MSVYYWWQLVAIIRGTHVHGPKLKFPKKNRYMEEDRLSLLGALIHRSNPHGFTYTVYLLFSLAESFLPLPPVQLRISVASVMCTCYLFIVRTPLTHLLPVIMYCIREARSSVGYVH
jgi:hypothetical protein